ncbi:MAG: LicD family protein, partial [Alphaproteobacteria bacterium]
MIKVKNALWIMLGTVSMAFATGNKVLIDLDSSPIENVQQIKKSMYTDPAIVQSVYQAIKDVSEVFEMNNFEYRLTFGSLLGAVRHKGFIPWDDDLDFLFFMKDRPALLALLPQFKKLGYTSNESKERPNFALFKTVTLQKGPRRTSVQLAIDLFPYELQGDKFVLYANPPLKKMFPNHWYHKSEIEAKKRYAFGPLSLWGPLGAEAYLERGYGADWNKIGARTHTHLPPKATEFYKWTMTEEDRKPALPENPLGNKVAEAFPVLWEKKVSLDNISSFWDGFYAKDLLKREPSSFCQFLLKEGWVKPKTILLDVGCGNGRDTLAFFKSDVTVYGIDLSPKAIEANKTLGTQEKMPPETFNVVDVADEKALAAYQHVDQVYARFFLHGIPELVQKKFLGFLSTLRLGAKVFLEFRTDKDPLFQKSKKMTGNETVTDHYRRFINLAEMWKLLEASCLKVDYALEAHSLSSQGEDNPFLGRI